LHLQTQIIGENGKYNRTDAWARSVYWDEVFLPSILPAIKFTQAIIVTENPIEASVGTVTTCFTDLMSETGTTGAVIYAGPVRTRALYSGHWRDVLRVVMEVLFFLLTAYMTYDELVDYKITVAQGYNSRAKYFTNFWNVFDTVSIFLLYLLFLFQYLIVIPSAEPTYRSGEWPTSSEFYLSKTWPSVQLLQTLVLGWSINFLLTGGRGFKYFRAHRGLGVFIQVFAKTVKSVQDFLVWFIAIIGWLTVVYNLLYTLVGANSDFATPGGSLNAVALLTFGFYDYETLFNTGLGFGFTPWMSTVLFWLLVFIALMFAQNIILAIVAEAYSDCAAKVEEGELPFIRMCIRRLIYEGLRVLRHQSTKIKALKVDGINHDDDAAVHDRAEMLSRRDDHLKYCRGTVKQVMDNNTKFLIEYNTNNTTYVETVRIGSIKGVVENAGGDEYIQDMTKNETLGVGKEVDVRYPYIWTEKLYLQYATVQSDWINGFYYYFQDKTFTSPKFFEGWLFDRGIAIHKAWKQFKFTEGGPHWDWQNPDSLLDYPMTYSELKILTKEVCDTLNKGTSPLSHGLFPVCTGDDTAKLARDIFISFSEESPIKSNDPQSDFQPTSDFKPTSGGGVFNRQNKNNHLEKEIAYLKQEMKQQFNDFHAKLQVLLKQGV
jgi:hypothetical protein